MHLDSHACGTRGGKADRERMVWRRVCGVGGDVGGFDSTYFIILSVVILQCPD